MCGRQCRVGARNGGQDAVVGRGGNTAEGQLGRRSECAQRCRRRMGSGSSVLAVGVLRAASEDCCWPTFRRCVDKARRAVHRDNRAKRGDDVPLAPSESAALDLTPINGAARRDGGCGRAQSPNCLIY
jgi:hypothetical protein